MEHIYLNFYTIGSLIPAAFTTLGMVFIFTIPNRSKATNILGWMMISLTIFYLGYVLASSIYHPIGSYHRWFTGIAILFINVFIARFFFYFLEEKAIKTSNYIFIIMMTISFLHGIYFLISTLRAEQTFNFESHYWDFFMPDISKTLAYFIMLFVIIMIITGIWKTIVLKGRNRYMMMITLFSFFISTVPPGILNTMSREGLISHSVFLNTFDILAVITLFSIIILFINNTKDRTTFMAKIIGISMVVFLLLMQAVNYLFMIEKEDFYNQKKLNQTARIIHTDYRPKDLIYLNKLNYKERRIENILLNSKSFINTDQFLNEYLISYYYSLFQEAKNKDEIKKIFKMTPYYFLGYIYTIKNLMNQYKNKPDAKLQIEEEIFSLYRNILYLKNKIKKIAIRNDFTKNLKKTLKKNGRKLPGFQKAILEYTEEESKNQEISELKKNIIQFLTPLKNLSSRHYRKDKTGKIHFISFMYKDSSTGILYEAGFSYLEYRIFIHKTAIHLFWLFLAVSLLTTIGLPLFYYRTIIFPLNTLLSGVRQVNRGNLEVEIPVMIQDEMGFLSESFNKMVRSIQNSKQKLQNYADNLEDMVNKRTEELKKRLDEINQLKTQQDGDYFLTSLLLNPLSNNLVKSNSVEVDFILKQKKAFSFRKWTREIGGDLCVAHSIFLKGNPYTVVLNADAMGKSMQGAGGILVLGSVFQSIIDRTLSVPIENEKFPEIWLKHASIELHKVFLSFNGSMLISMVLGLLDDKTGLLYFINAEHPFSALYRDSKAEFIENEMTVHRKLGTTITEGNLSIQTFQMQNQDVIFLGSDGRDDIILKENGQINEDETRFLKTIEICNGRLNCIHKALLETGKLLDDLSIMKISYNKAETKKDDLKKNEEYLKVFNELKNLFLSKKEKSKAYKKLKNTLHMWPEDSAMLKMGIRNYIRDQKYTEAITLLSDYTLLYPQETDYIFLYSYCLKKVKKYNEGATMGERVRIRNPQNISNLINLSEIYLRLKNMKRAELLINEALALETGNTRAKRILEIITKNY